MQEKRDAQTCSSHKVNTEGIPDCSSHIHIPILHWCHCCSPRSWWHQCHPSAPVPVLDNEGRGHNLAGCVSHPSLTCKNTLWV